MKHLRQQQYPHSTNLPALRRLAHTREQQKRRYRGKTIQEWIQELALTQARHHQDWLFVDLSVFEEIGIVALPILIETLAHEKWRFRWCAARLLQLFGLDAQESIPALSRVLNDSRASIRQEVLNALIAIEILPSRLLPHCIRLLKDKDAGVAALAARTIALFGPVATEAIPMLIKALDHSSLFYRSEAAHALSKVGIGRADVIATISENLVIDEKNLPALTCALVRLAPEKLKELLPSLSSAQTHHILNVLEVLGTEASAFFSMMIADYPYTRREVLLQMHLEMLHQQSRNPQRELQQLQERIQRRGTSRKQQHLLASLRRRALEEHDLLRKRVDLGDLASERLELAAHLGYLPAIHALHQKQDTLSRQKMSDWADGLSRYGSEVCARIGHALGRSVLPFWEWDYPEDNIPREALLTLENWICAPKKMRHTYARKVEQRGEFWPNRGCTGTSAAAAWVIAYATQQLRHPIAYAMINHAVIAWTNTPDIDPYRYFKPRPTLPMHTKRAEIHVRQLIRDMLIPWVLQDGDPIQDALAPLAAQDPQWFQSGY